MVPSLVMAAEDDVALKRCTGGFELQYFNFYVNIEKFTEEECKDFDEIGKLVQTVIEETQDCIPEYEDEFIQAEVCPDPTFVDERRLHLRGLARRKRRAGTYSFAGTGGCKRCRRSSSDRRRLEVEEDTTETYHPVQLNDFKSRVLKDEEEEFFGTFEEHICSMGDKATVDAAIATRAVVAAEKRLQELLIVSEEQETTSLLDGREIEKYIEEAKKKVEEMKEDNKWVMARAFFIENACESINTAVVDTVEDEGGYLSIAGDLKKDTGKDAKHAQGGYYKVKDKKIGLKTAVVKSRFDKIKGEMEEEHAKLRAELDEEVGKIEEEIDVIEDKLRMAKEKGDKKKEEKLKEEKETLEDDVDALVDEFGELMRLDKDKFDQEYDFAIGTLEVEAANTFEDYMEAFADLIKPVLEERLKTFSDCFDGQPKVELEVEELESKKEQLKKCP